MTTPREELAGPRAIGAPTATERAAAQSGAPPSESPGNGSSGPGQPAGSGRRLAPGFRTCLTALGWLAASCGLFLCYLRASLAVPVLSDGAANVLQASDMLHGNLLLHGWWLSDVSFYTTELPEYMLVDWVHGLSPDVIHAAAALTYTLLMVLTALLAKGRATGRAAVVRVLVAGGIMLAPQVGTGASVLLLSPDHVGSAVPVLLLFLLVDRAPPRWYVPVLAGVILTWALVADQVILITGIVPLAAVCGLRACRAIVNRQQPAQSRWFDFSLIGAAAAAVCVSRAAQAWLAGHGGFIVFPASTRLVSGALGFQHAVLAIPQDLLVLFGAVFSSQSSGAVNALATVHLIGLALAVWAVCSAVRRFGSAALTDQLLVTAVLVNLIAFALFTRATFAPGARELAAVLPLSAALAARVLGPRLTMARLRPFLIAAFAGYVLSLVNTMTVPLAPAQNAPLAAWLAAHHLDDGLAGYWDADLVTVVSHTRVLVAPVNISGRSLAPCEWESQKSWYNPVLHDANFVVLAGFGQDKNPLPGRAARAEAASLSASFGPPAHRYRPGQGYTVLVWNKNLLPLLSAG